jgi:hypothetical protein
MEKHLRAFVTAKAAHLILDLRTPAPPGNFDDAADMLSLFRAERARCCSR